MSSAVGARIAPKIPESFRPNRVSGADSRLLYTVSRKRKSRSTYLADSCILELLPGRTVHRLRCEPGKKHGTALGGQLVAPLAWLRIDSDKTILHRQSHTSGRILHSGCGELTVDVFRPPSP